MLKKIIFFDVETNGLKGTSVLSMSAMKMSFDTETLEMYKLGEFNRFYFRDKEEPINEGAISVNGLTDEEIQRRRSQDEVKYPLTFKEDISSFIEFCEGCKHYVAHNIRFDRDFVPFKLEYQFDTMIENIDIVRIMGARGYKWPKLMECAGFYKVPLEENNLHNSLYDVEVMAKVFFRMRKNSIGKNRILRFVNNNISTAF